MNKNKKTYKNNIWLVSLDITQFCACDKLDSYFMLMLAGPWYRSTRH